MKFGPKPKPITLHVINHTHWDREWFVPYTFTSRWIPRLIKNLEKMVERNPDYQFLLDAQTGVLEDLAATDTETYAIARRLIHSRNLLVGPYYAQIETRMPGPESLVRNLRIGIDTAESLGASADFSAWSVDMFGHISQLPQINAMFGIRDVYLWRGPSSLEPFFAWKGADGTTMQAIFLFAGGYRNFYKVTSKARLALPRLKHEVKKLQPYYAAGHIPVFDGFDLDYEPGDAASHFAEYHSKKLEHLNVSVVNASPQSFAQEIRKTTHKLPELSGELISGKYASVFPGVLSNRTYSKLAADHCERLLYRYAEPLSLLLPTDQYPGTVLEDQCKLILQNLVHDVISGCSIDQVHKIAEQRTTEIDTSLRAQISHALSWTAGMLQDGTYAYTPATGQASLRVEHAGKLYHIKSHGIGIVPVDNVKTLTKVSRPVKNFRWKNHHYSTTLNQDGHLTVGQGVFGQLVVRDEAGDTYWDEPRGHIKELKITSPIQVEAETDTWARISFTATEHTAERTITAHITITFDDSPLLKWQIRLSTTGTGFSVMLRHAYKQKITKLNVGMPFDNVERPFTDTDLLGRHISPSLTSLLNSSTQRDLVKTFTFPFHGYISPATNTKHVHLLAKGLRAYQTEEPGNIDVVLSRTVDWLMKPSVHEYHAGDAGPKYYVPDARSQREITLECALLISNLGPDDMAFHQTVDQYLNPPLLFKVDGSQGTETQLPLFDDNVVVSSLHIYNGKRLARIYNPTSHTVSLQHSYTGADRHGHPVDGVAQLQPKKIHTITLESPTTPVEHHTTPRVTAVQWFPYPVRPDLTKPDPQGMTKLKAIQKDLRRELDDLHKAILAYGSTAEVPSSLQHRFYVTARESMEADLSLFWNDSALKGVDPLFVDEQLYKLATEYNDLRIMRRMYDYIIDIDSRGSPRALPSGRFLKFSQKLKDMNVAGVHSTHKLRQFLKSSPED